MSVRVRMAPSPTGEYHIGHIRTALYNWAFAKKNGGEFIIRIEDTDRERFVDGATERILEIIKKYGLDWDEGPERGGDFGPYIQSDRLPIYKKYAEELVQKGHAYYCFCSKKRLDELRQKQKDLGLPVTKYDKHCLNLSPEEVQKKLSKDAPFVIRLNVPDNREISFTDQVYGEIKINSDDIDDQVLIKSDGFPTYHIAVVVDDHLMGITHILRGMDWIPSTPKHVLLYEAFGWDLPVFAHLPNIKELGESKKLSKRYGSVFAMEFLREGYLPKAVLNFLMFLGWNPGTEKEIYSLEEFVADFSLEKVHKTDLVAFDRQKLLWMNGYYIRNLSSSDLWREIKNWADYFGLNLSCVEYPEDYITQVLDQVKDRMKLLSDFEDITSYYFKTPVVPLDLLISYTNDLARTSGVLTDFISLYKRASDWQTPVLDQISHKLAEEKGYLVKEAFMTLRVALTGQKATPPLFDILSLIGREKTLERLQSSQKLIQK